MAKQKPKYPQAELKNIGAGYDKIGFKNSAIDMLKNKMSEHVTEWNDIIPVSAAPQAPEKAGRDIWRGGDKQWFEPNKRNEIIKQTYESVGPLTGKKGYSKSTAGKYSSELKKMKRDETYGTREAFDYFNKK